MGIVHPKFTLTLPPATLSGAGSVGTESITTLLQEDFSDSSWYENWHDSSKVYADDPGGPYDNAPYNYGSSPPRISRVTPSYNLHGYAPNPAGSGYAAEVTILKGNNNGNGRWSFFPRVSANHLTQGGTNPTEMYLEYYMRLGSTWNGRLATTSGKFPGISGDFDDGGKGNFFDELGMNGWSARLEWFNKCASPNELKTVFGTYTYAVEDSDFNPAITPEDDPGRGIIWDNMNCTPLVNNAMVINTWYKIKTYCKANVGNNRNGITRGWLNDVQRCEHDQILWTKNTSYQAVDRAWMNIYHGGGSQAVPDQDLHVFFTDVHIWVPN